MQVSVAMGRGAGVTLAPMDDRLDRIEMRIAWLEQANAELGDVVYAQRREIAALEQKLATLSGRLEAAHSAPTPYTPEQERPPHY